MHYVIIIYLIFAIRYLNKKSLKRLKGFSGPILNIMYTRELLKGTIFDNNNDHYSLFKC